jgi:hypothetical protein
MNGLLPAQQLLLLRVLVVVVGHHHRAEVSLHWLQLTPE